MKPRTHILRAKPPWRDGAERTRCGRRVTGEAPCRAGYASRAMVTEADDAMAAQAAADWRSASWKAATGRLEAVRVTPPHGICAPCWQNLGIYGLKTWTSDPLEVLRIDLAVTDREGRVMLARELVALADLRAAHQGEFRERLASEEVLAALAEIRM